MAGVDLTRIAKRHANSAAFGLPKERFATPDGDSLIATSDQGVDIRLPAALFVGREFVVDARLHDAVVEGLIRVRAALTPPDATTRWDGPVLASPDGADYQQLVAGRAEFRKVFPLFLCFPQVVPTDEVVTLKMFHREDEPLVRLFLTDLQARLLDRLWGEQRFVSRQPVAEYDYLPQFMGYTTQDTPKAFQDFFIDRRPLFKKHADDFLKAEQASEPKQLDALLAFAEKAYRRPLTEKELADLRTLYYALRKKGMAHDEAFRGVAARILVAPPFLFRIEAAPEGKGPAPVSDWELATRLSYFLWSSAPDVRAWLPRGSSGEGVGGTGPHAEDAHALGIEFGTQWIHGFDTLTRGRVVSNLCRPATGHS